MTEYFLPFCTIDLSIQPFLQVVVYLTNYLLYCEIVYVQLQLSPVCWDVEAWTRMYVPSISVYFVADDGVRAEITWEQTIFWVRLDLVPNNKCLLIQQIKSQVSSIHSKTYRNIISYFLKSQEFTISTCFHSCINRVSLKHVSRML